MKQIYKVWLIASLMTMSCAGENGGNQTSSKLLLGILNDQPSKIVANSDRKSSESVIFDIPTLYVDSISGNDSTNPGTKSAPFRTITKAILAATANNIKVIAVAPGTYSGSIGETFPITIPADVNLYGDSNGKGLIGGSSSLYAGPPGTTPKTGPTFISGNGPDIASGRSNVTLALRDSSQVSGFKITNPKPFDSSVYSTTILLHHTYAAKVNKNTIEGVFGGHGILIGTASYTPTKGGNIITGNSFLSNYNGISDYTYSTSNVNKVENNFFTQNHIGVQSVYIKLDLGQGTTGSVGGNTFSCNDHQDLSLGAGASGQTQYALNNFWDHMPPTTQTGYSGYGADIVNYNNATLVYYAGGAVAPGACN
ncbi:PF07602 family protein [Leptospira weilii serovar Ranarum str. ICFT]|uniref:PF07602 family protein n=1 Tax=Leptospira weilii serovar Ranarum str. ICFT TaxID=1218598 RepID=N1WRJ1_9LEPT|nr:DUF1565 domain-containing protein [Leptospira weilii]EMY79754.1 PF07602 family protein [Leptospira weilii serovar Ranarum str. ICFT]